MKLQIVTVQETQPTGPTDVVLDLRLGLMNRVAAEAYLPCGLGGSYSGGGGHIRQRRNNLRAAVAQTSNARTCAALVFLRLLCRLGRLHRDCVWEEIDPNTETVLLSNRSY